MWRCQCRPLKIDGTPAGRPLGLEESCPVCQAPPPLVPPPVVDGSLANLATGSRPFRRPFVPRRRGLTAEHFTPHRSRFETGDTTSRQALAKELGVGFSTLCQWARKLKWAGFRPRRTPDERILLRRQRERLRYERRKAEREAVA